MRFQDLKKTGVRCLDKNLIRLRWDSSRRFEACARGDTPACFRGTDEVQSHDQMQTERSISAG